MKECTVFVCTDINDPIAAGKFAIDDTGQGHFIYGRKWRSLTTSFAFDPINLPLNEAQQSITVHGDGTYGVLSDAGPNNWGKKVAHSICRVQKIDFPSNPVEWLLHASNFGSGCLAFTENPSQPPEILTTSLPSLTELDSKFIALTDDLDSIKDPELIRLIAPGASLGGVRPKTVVIHDNAEYIVKLNRRDDLFDVSTVEYASLRLAHLAKIDVPDFELVKVGDRPALIIKRFDRTENSGRLHYISANSLLNVNQLIVPDHEYRTRYSYAGIAEISRKIDPEAVTDSHQIYRRMVFNILIGNVDDHLRNHGFIMTDKPGKYRLSPAFDILPHLESAAAPQYIGVGAYGRASTIDNALSQSGRFFLNSNQAEEIIQEVLSVVTSWKRIFKESGVSNKDIQLLGSCFDVANTAAFHGKH